MDTDLAASLLQQLPNSVTKLADFAENWFSLKNSAFPLDVDGTGKIIDFLLESTEDFAVGEAIRAVRYFSRGRLDSLEYLSKRNCLSKLLSILKDENARHSKCWAMGLLTGLTWASDDYVTRLAEEGLIPVFIGYLSHSDILFQLHAAQILGNLVHGPSALSNAQSLIELGVLGRIATLMTSSSKLLTEKCFLIIRNIADCDSQLVCDHIFDKTINYY